MVSRVVIVKQNHLCFHRYFNRRFGFVSPSQETVANGDCQKAPGWVLLHYSLTTTFSYVNGRHRISEIFRLDL